MNILIKRLQLGFMLLLVAISGILIPLVPTNTVSAADPYNVVSAEALPSVEILDGIVWSQVIVGNTVYATGCFSQVSEAKVVTGGQQYARKNILAYDITTGRLTSFNHRLERSNGSAATCKRDQKPAEGRSLTVSPDKKYLFVAGNFDIVDGKTGYGRIAAFDISALGGGSHVEAIGRNQQGPSIPLTSSWGTLTHLSITATDNKLFVAGNFSYVNPTATSTGVARENLAIYDYRANIGSTPAWSLNARGHTFAKSTPGSEGYSVNAVALTQDGSKVIVGGNFGFVNGEKRHAVAAFTSGTGELVMTWGSSADAPQYPLVNDISYPSTRDSGVTSISSNANYIFLTGWAQTRDAGAYEGRAAVSATDGSFKWVNDCHGDSYSSFPIGNILYSSSHAHTCISMGTFPDKYGYASVPAGKSYTGSRHALAETIPANDSEITLKNGPTSYGYPSFEGLPRTEQLHWYPVFTPSANNWSDAYQAGWSVVGNDQYVAYGGEFSHVNNVERRGLVRFAIRSIQSAPNQEPDTFNPEDDFIASSVATDGTLTLRVPTTSDPDDKILTYRVYKDDTIARLNITLPLDDVAIPPICKTTRESTFWNRPTFTCIDTNTTRDSLHQYAVVATDPLGKSVMTKNYYSAQLDDTSPEITYSKTGEQSDWQTDTSKVLTPGYATPLNNTLHFTDKIGASLDFQFIGSNLDLYVYEHENGADRVDVYIDGATTPITFSTYALGWRSKESRRIAENLPFGLHSVRIVNNSTVVSGQKLKVFAFDAARVLSTRPHYITINTSQDIQYNAGGDDASWNSPTGIRTALDKDFRYTDINGDSIFYTFYGDSISVITSRYRDVGKAMVYLDGSTIGQEVDAYTPDTDGKRGVLYEKSGLTPGKHTVRIVKTSGTHLILDAFVVSSSAPISVIDSTNKRITYSATTQWYTYTYPQPTKNTHFGRYYGQGYRYTNINDASATLTFNGSYVAILSERQSGLGDIAVTIDGVARPTVSAYGSAPARTQQILAEYSLSPGNHTITIAKKSGAYMFLDGFIIR